MLYRYTLKPDGFFRRTALHGADQLEAHNLFETERLNQRGGRTLSFVDLIEAGTVSAEMAGELAATVERGASVLTAAKLGGVGKSTLLADLLACLPPGERIVTTPDASAVEAAHSDAPQGRVCYLAHEIGPGHWYAYLWGKAAARFVGLAARRGEGRGEGIRIAGCLHADDVEELYGILEAQGVPVQTIGGIGLLAFMRRSSGRRRVVSVYVPADGEHRLRWSWDESSDRFERHGDPPVDADRAAGFAGVFRELAGRGISGFEPVRGALLEVIAPKEGR